MSSHSDPHSVLPHQPIHRLIAPVERFLHVEAAGGVVLLACTVVSLAIANSPLAAAYHDLWHTKIGFQFGSLSLSGSLEFWVNDALMSLFFFLVGLEVKRELVIGELRDPRAAMLPVMAAIGGMIVPAAIYLSLLSQTPAAHGWGVPVATDIAFVVGCMAVLGSRVPRSLRVMLLTLAIADDIGAILVIAIGYSSGISVSALAFAAAMIVLIAVLLRIGIRSLRIYSLCAALVWLAVLKSGVHATIAGVVLGLLTPARPLVSGGTLAHLFKRIAEVAQGDGWTATENKAQRLRDLRRVAREALSPLEYLEHVLHPWVSFVIMPLFALANAGVHLHVAQLLDPVAVGVALSLLIGKPIGVVALSWIAIAIGIARLPNQVSWWSLTAGGFLCGIGFTMSLFVANLGLSNEVLDAAKIGILLGSTTAALLGCGAFYFIGAAGAPLSPTEPSRRESAMKKK